MLGGELGVLGGLVLVVVAAGVVDLVVEGGVDLTDSSSSEFSLAVPSEVHV